MSDELQVDPELLFQAAQGIDGVISSLSTMGIAETGTAGRGFSLIALSPNEIGNLRLQKSLEAFAERWGWGIRTLVQSASGLAEALELQAGRFHELDQLHATTLDTAWANVSGPR